MRLSEILMAHIRRTGKPIFGESLDEPALQHLREVEDEQLQEALRQLREKASRRLRRRVLRFRVSAAEHEAILQQAEQAGMTVSQLIRARLLESQNRD